MSNTNEQRRRSTRVSQLVPVVVRGMDLLGQPFEEHTTTTNFNFHGCAYASRHHLPRNTWISIEPLQEGVSGECSCVRARVVWIEQPQMAYDQFQIAVELEAPANIWGVSAPEDWENRNISESGYANSPYANSIDQPADAVDTYNASSEQSVPQQMEQSMTFGEFQENLSGQINEAPLNDSNGGMETAPSESMSAAPGIHQAVDERSRAVSQEPINRADEMFQRWREHFEEVQSKAGEQLSSEMNERLTTFEREFRSGLETETTESRNRLGEMATSLQDRCDTLRAELKAAEISLSCYANLGRRLDEVQADLERRNEEIASEAWRHQLQKDVQLARGQWDELLQSSLDSAVQRLSQRLSENSNEMLAAAEQRIESIVGDRTERAREVLRELSVREMQSEEGLRLYRERLRQAIQSASNDVHSQSESTLAEVRADLQAARNDALAGFSAELGAIGHSSTSVIEESLAKSMESHVESAREQVEAFTGERLHVLDEAANLKAQAVSRNLETEQAERVAQFGADLQTAAGQAVEDSRGKIEEAAQEAARRIAGELEANASQIQTEMNAAAGETVSSSRSQIEQAAAAAAASFGQVLNGISDQALDQFRQSSRGTADERTSDIERSAAKLREEFEKNVFTVAEQLSGDTLSRIRHTLTEMSDVFRSECHATLESLKSGRESLQQEWRSGLDAMSSEMIQVHKQRLDNISNAWQADSIQRLNDRGDELIQRLSRTGEQVVRNSFTRIFDGLSEAMRENFSNAAVAGASASVAQASSSETGASEAQVQH